MKRLDVETAVDVVGLLIGMLPETGMEGLRYALNDAVEIWPGTDWEQVSVELRKPEQDAWKIATMLEQEVVQENGRRAKLGLGPLGS